MCGGWGGVITVITERALTNYEIECTVNIASSTLIILQIMYMEVIRN